MKKLLILVTVVSILSCTDDDLQTCSNIENKTWFNELKAELNENCNFQVSIFEGSYNGETVYYQLITDPVVNFQALIKFYNCDGEIVADLTPEESNDYLDGPGRNDEKIFTCSSSE